MKEPIRVGDTVQWGVNRGEVKSIGGTHSIVARAFTKDTKVPNSRLELIFRPEDGCFSAYRKGVFVGYAATPREAVDKSFGMGLS